jgi:hypothetical protein
VEAVAHRRLELSRRKYIVANHRDGGGALRSNVLFPRFVPTRPHTRAKSIRCEASKHRRLVGL